MIKLYFISIRAFKDIIISIILFTVFYVVDFLEILDNYLNFFFENILNRSLSEKVFWC